MKHQATSDKWERRRRRQDFMNRCAKLKPIAPQLSRLAARKIWDRASAIAQSQIEHRTKNSDTALATDFPQSQIKEQTN